MALTNLIGKGFSMGTRSVLDGSRGNTGHLKLGEESVGKREQAITDQMIASIKAISRQRHPDGVIKRFNQSKGLGCFDASFEVIPDLPANLKVGLFAHARSYPARIRFANATQDDDNKKDFRGMSIKLLDVEGTSLWGENGTQDFILNSYPALFAANPEHFLDFINATREDRTWAYLTNPSHWYSLNVVMSGRKKIASPFDISYFSTTPYRFGMNKSVAVKYAVTPCSTYESKMSEPNDRNYLSIAMNRHLEKEDACFEFKVQFQKDAKHMPVENSAVVWDESESPFISVAKITISKQDFFGEQAVARCESMSFNPWQSLPEHKPIGGINRVRGAVYAALSEFRQSENQARVGTKIK